MKPAVVTDRCFRSRVRDLLVELPNPAGGMGLIVTGDENVVMAYPRAGRAIHDPEDLSALVWYQVHVRAGKTGEFSCMDNAAVARFLAQLARLYHAQKRPDQADRHIRVAKIR